VIRLDVVTTAPHWWRELAESLSRCPSLGGYPVDDVQRLARELAIVLEVRRWELRRKEDA
jgi:hypothetical protein